ncbi:cobalt-precorrin-6A reductase [Thalassospira marina]|uniref:Precorrin-6A reductase n=1 Tax=Thalassospira marina TaxID=2048283 RepID=A0ABM6QF67_9PROT|nr:cobalt-precorrin-6A reductase [Thalassospira marina]AUG55259.1 precorrin-6A reductase [Thalassospira marina]
MPDPDLRLKNHLSPLNVLVFGGTGDANRITSELLVRFGSHIRLQLSLAGRTSAPNLPDGVPVRIGGFGGPEGIVKSLQSDGIDLVIDATHPFATQISAHIADACKQAGTPCIQYHRAPWIAQQGDHWINVPDIQTAAAKLPSIGKRALIAIGRRHLHCFNDLHDCWLLVRTVEAPNHPFDLANGEWLSARGPFSPELERELLERHEIDVVVTKNSGGDASEGKLIAARELGIPVIMIDRPPLQAVDYATSTEEVVQKVAQQHTAQ